MGKSIAKSVVVGEVGKGNLWVGKWVGEHEGGGKEGGEEVHVSGCGRDGKGCMSVGVREVGKGCMRVGVGELGKG